MSRMFTRSVSTLIPPKIASPSGLGAAKDAARMSKVVEFYTKLPKGPAPVEKPSGLLGRYKARYFDGQNASAAPLIQLLVGVMVIGYAQNYYFHLRHHKNNAH